MTSWVATWDAQGVIPNRLLQQEQRDTATVTVRRRHSPRVELVNGHALGGCAFTLRSAVLVVVIRSILMTCIPRGIPGPLIGNSTGPKVRSRGSRGASWCLL